MTTKGCQLCVKCKYGLSNFISLNNLKDSYSVELDDYSINNNINYDMDFSWWVPYVRNKWDTIIAKVKYKYCQITHKYGSKITKYVNAAYNINVENINNF